MMDLASDIKKLNLKWLSFFITDQACFSITEISA